MEKTGVQIGGYELLRPIGRGGMAEVWVARRANRRAGKYVAIKLIADAYVGDPRFKRMFRAEAELSALLNHANIVQVFDEGEEDGRSYLVMEWVDGVNLLKIEAALTFIDDEEWRLKITSYIIGQLLHALSYAHSVTMHDGNPLGIVHRDVTPQNVLVSTRGEVKLTDFGVAHYLLEQSSGTHVKGKIRYMAPEHLAGDQRDPRVDLFAVGAILHEMVDGRRFRHHVEDQRDMYAEILSGAVPRLSRIIPPELDELRLGLLHKDPQQRIATADDALEVLEQYPGYGDARRDLTELCSTLTGVVRPRVGPGISDAFPGAEQPRAAPPAERPATSGGQPAHGSGSQLSPAPRISARAADTGEQSRTGGVPQQVRTEMVSGELIGEGGQTGQTAPQIPVGMPGMPSAKISVNEPPTTDVVSATTARAMIAAVSAPPPTPIRSDVTATSNLEATAPSRAQPSVEPADPAPRRGRDTAMLGLTALSLLVSLAVMGFLVLDRSNRDGKPASSVAKNAASERESGGDRGPAEQTEPKPTNANETLKQNLVLERPKVDNETESDAEPIPKPESPPKVDPNTNVDSRTQAPNDGRKEEQELPQRSERTKPTAEPETTKLTKPAAEPEKAKPTKPEVEPKTTKSRTSSRPKPAPPRNQPAKKFPLTIKVRIAGKPGKAQVRLAGGTAWAVNGVKSESIREGRHRLEWKRAGDSSWIKGPRVKVEGCGVIIDIQDTKATYRPFKNCK